MPGGRPITAEIIAEERRKDQEKWELEEKQRKQKTVKFKDRILEEIDMKIYNKLCDNGKVRQLTGNITFDMIRFPSQKHYSESAMLELILKDYNYPEKIPKDANAYMIGDPNYSDSIGRIGGHTVVGHPTIYIPVVFYRIEK